MLRDRIVMGIRDTRLQAKLLDSDNLTYDTAVQKCRSSEATSLQSKEMNISTSVNEVRTQTNSKNYNNNRPHQQQRNYANSTNRKSFNNSLNKNKQNKNYNESNFKKPQQTNNTNNKNSEACRYCNLEHAPKNCPAYGKTCNVCSRKNHFASVCRNNKRVDTINAIDFENEFFCHAIEGVAIPKRMNILNNDVYKRSVNKTKAISVDSVNTGRPIWREDINVNGKFVSFKVDSGSDVTIMPKHLLDVVAPNVKLKESNTLLKAFGGGVVKPLGVCLLNCTLKNRGHILNEEIAFEIVDIDTVPLLGLIGAVNFNLIDIRRISNLRKNASNHFL